MIKMMHPDYLNPLHPVGFGDGPKVDEIRESMEANGWVGRPLLAYDNGNGIHALTGSHRIEAAAQAGLDTVPVYVIDASGDQPEWLVDLIEANDDEDRLSAVEGIITPNAVEAAKMMEAEIHRDVEEV